MEQSFIWKTGHKSGNCSFLALYITFLFVYGGSGMPKTQALNVYPGYLKFEDDRAHGLYKRGVQFGIFQ